MRYRLLGKSGLRVSELCLGTMTFGEDWGFGASAEECGAIFRLFVERGGNFIDTANVYTNGTSEKIVGDLVAPERHRFVVATKYSLTLRPDDPNAGGNARKSMVQAVEGSLKRLRTDYIDLFWVHAWDFYTPVEEVMRGLDDLIRAGKVLYVGVSDTPAWVVAQANTLAELRGLSAFVGLQIEYSLIERTAERELLPMARALDIGVTAWGAIGGGVLSGKYSKAGQAEDSRRVMANQHRAREKSLAIAAEAQRIAKELGKTPAQVALAWVRQQPGVVIPILGARKAAQAKDNLDSLDLSLGGEHLARLDRASAIERGFPHDFMSSDMARSLLYGSATVVKGGR
jgi:aryl-alcohol dehydrogenase-like predicted oxidoreductase